jgi:Zn-dependent protease with chaperone function
MVDGSSVAIIATETDLSLKKNELSQCKQGMIIPGLAVSLEFDDGALFTPHDATFRWPNSNPMSALAAKLETNIAAILIAIAVLPVVVWLLITKVVPSAAAATAGWLPASVRVQMDEETLDLLELAFLEPSKLSEQQRRAVEESWLRVKSEIASDDYPYNLNLYYSPEMGANAFALPNGSVIVTDKLARILEDKPDAMVAILMHEVGHVESQHGVKLLAQSLGATLVVAMILGDLEGAAELFLGAGTSLLQNAFSRDMEREADDFAIARLQRLGIPSTAFADAIREVSGNGERESSRFTGLTKYLSSHPGAEDRIREAKAYAAPPAAR